MAGENAAEDPATDFLIVVVVEIEKRVAVVAVETEIPAGSDLRADATVPAELVRAGLDVVAPIVDCRDAPVIPTRSAKEVRPERPAREIEQERDLNGGFRDL